MHRRPSAVLVTISLIASLVPRLAASQAATDSTAIRRTALDYVEGWYGGDATRMARAVHPELVKRIVVNDTATKQSSIETMGATALVNATRHGWGKRTPAPKQQKEVRILDIFNNVASVRTTMAGWIDYMQMARVDGRWVIVNVLWEEKPNREDRG